MFSSRKGRLCQTSALFLRQALIKRTASSRRVFDGETGLFSVPVQFKNTKGDIIQLNAVYQDTMPDGGQRATVFALHGSPGSHADFKYLVKELQANRVRMILPNFPGHGLTPNDPRLSCDNEERNQFARAVLDSVDDIRSTDLYFMGHSRGGENAVQTATLELQSGNVRGIVMLNSAGLRRHRGIEPYWKIEIFVRLLDLRVINFILHPFLYFIYNRILGLKVPTGSAAATALRTMRTFALRRILPCVEAINQHSEVKFLHVYSGDDFLIQPDISKEFAEKFNDRVDLECSSTDSADVTRSTIEAFSKGVQTVSVNFVHEGHFSQKYRAQFLIDVILALISLNSTAVESTKMSNKVHKTYKL
ncbi:hypothetical protein RB195_003400 [Necator americanus]|uniref:AB hydrolase-1 domain-containing protein n=1 Tax=Necator americanus TaxID=51031 RepID=A0ABR1DR64_NECAM